MHASGEFARRRPAILSAALLLMAAVAHAYNLQTSPLWPAGDVSIHVQLGAIPAGGLLDGSPSWNEPIESAMAEWSQYLGLTRLKAVSNGTAPLGRLNGFNTVAFSDTIYGDAWTGRTLAYSLYWWQNNRRIETDVLFKSTGVDWNSYRGPQRGSTYDLRRFAVHELGHSIGLDHPDDVGQNVSAIMNGTLGNIEVPTADDVSGVRLLYANNAPVFVTQPGSQTVALGASVAFSSLAIGTPAPGYQWRKNGTAISGATLATLTFGMIAIGDAGSYTVVASNSAGTITSSSATLNVSSSPAIAIQPASQSVNPGTTVTLSISATGTAPLAYQWRKDGSIVTGAASATLVLTNISTASAGSYTVLVTNTLGSVTSSAAVLMINAAPAISAQPASQIANLGGNVTLSVAASGTPAPTYQWRRNGIPIAGATSATLTLPSVAISDGATYTVSIANSLGTVVSNAAALTVNWSQLTNLSVRSTAGTGEQTLIVGFSIGGTGTKQMLIRGVGPTLTTFGVPGVLADPLLQLFNSSSVQINQNNDWGGTAALTGAFNAVGAFALPATSRDAALLVRLAVGNYSAQILTTAGTGVVLVEGYDADAVTPATRLSNLSVRSVAGTDANILIVGFAISGTTPKSLLIRGVGPTLGVFGVTGVLTDPLLRVFNSSSAQIDQNDDWGGTATLGSAFASVGAFALTPTGKDAALLVNLAPGSYTAQVSGVGGTTGVALVEVYELP